MPPAPKLTPMFRQYRSLKEQHADSILLFRMGDFYEMFFEDAKEASHVLELTLTARGKGTDNVVPMCGFPHHQVDAYTARLVRANRRVAICEQVEDPRQARGLVRREVVRIVTPGTVNDPGQLDAKQNLWIAAVCRAARRLGAAFLDASTGEFLAWESDSDDEAGWAALDERLSSFAPREIVLPTGLVGQPPDFAQRWSARSVISSAEPFAFSVDDAAAALQRRFGVASMDGFGFHQRPAALAAGAGLVDYVGQTQRSGLEHIDGILYDEPSHSLLLDPATRRNLELERSLRDGGSAGSLFDALDETVTPAGARLLRRWLGAPLLDPTRIGRRLDAVSEIVTRSDIRQSTREQLRGVQDIERLLARTVAGSATPRDLVGLGRSLERLPPLVETLGGCRCDWVCATLDGLDLCQDLAQRIAAALVEEPPASLRDGNVIRDGFDPDLDELRSIRKDGRSYIAALEAAEREATGISSLKVKFNKVFGYFIEVSRANLHLAPEHYQRKQTIANGERFITPDLKEHEAKVLQAQERIESVEIELFGRLRVELASHAVRLKQVARATARWDVVSALAETAARHDYVRPTVSDAPEIKILGGRHPVVEQSLVDLRFVPNDASLASGTRAVGVLTGPNMGGKSTYLRQVALIALMAQTGSFVPADEAEIGIVDRVFCRVGASDSLSEGQSTFMVEMAETANILHHATPRSLLLLDEIGRGTSTFDGLSIAWAVVEHLAGMTQGAPRCLFATHYHELTELAIELEPVFNLRMAVREHGDDVVFLHRVEEGAADRSYGIHVARLAGIPAAVVRRAQEILTNIEQDEFSRDGTPRRARRRDGSRAPAKTQPTLFDALAPGPGETQVLDELKRLRPEGMTPIEALNRIAAWVERLRDDSTH